ncbi:hypothetical protein PRIPAC_81183 [Pristionchus pacificus]|nr:hypothetical protein PRIPAC_81183 [Pristionchus pacificus]
MEARLFFSLLLLFLIVDSGNAYKILVYNSKFAHSHSNYLGRVADILVEAGNNTSLIPIMDPSLRDGTLKSHVMYVQPDPEVASFYENPQEVNFFDINMWNPIAPFIIGAMFSNVFEKTCAKVVSEPGLIDKLREEKYDVFIAESFDLCGIGIAKAINPKSVIGSSTTFIFGWQVDEFGVDAATSFRSNMMTVMSEDSSLYTRVWNIYAELSARLAFLFPRLSINRVVKERFGADYPSIAEQSANVAYVITNSEPLIESASPTSSRVIDCPGLGAQTPKPLDEHWEEVLNRRNKTILLSFGSIAKSFQLSDDNKAGILKAISKFPDVTFIWKYEKPEDEFCTNHASKLKNLVTTKWMPQVDILNHTNLAAFITHGGMGSTQETALRGVPGIFIPIFGDQLRNAAMMQFNGLGKVYDKRELHDGDKLAATIKEVIENKNYAENSKRLSKMLVKKPFSSRDLLVKHVEFAAEFGEFSIPPFVSM